MEMASKEHRLRVKTFDLFLSLLSVVLACDRRCVLRFSSPISVPSALSVFFGDGLTSWCGCMCAGFQVYPPPTTPPEPAPPDNPPRHHLVKATTPPTGSHTSLDEITCIVYAQLQDHASCHCSFP